MEEILIIIVQFLFEFTLSMFADLPFDWFFGDRGKPDSGILAFRCCLWFVGGCLLALLSMCLFRNALITIPALRLCNLIAAPIASACLSQAIAKRRAEINEDVIPRNHFWQAFWFTFGLVLVRFAYTSRT